ncbi:MAG: hypothetical protein CVV23_10925 [Ignavibacteriae bacterium HGW-Ignavibacteriae-2]|nr:DUF4292 domain-containing protein [Bacteroidota bacterium]PKL88326.1 MAG: hypothetical protein CVV23_10925 [Ignavibacteriae bacterium HGW-Ignavibacteriae-2]
MKQTNILRITALFLMIILMQNCIPSKPDSEERLLPADRLIKKIEGNRRKVKTFVGNGIINIESPKFTGNASFEIALKKPDSIKISIYGPFGIDLAHGLVTKNSFEFYDVMKNNLYKGNSSAEILREIFKIDLSFNDLVDAFSGSINLTDKLTREPDYYKQNDDDYIMTYINEKTKTKSVYAIGVDNLALLNFKTLDEKNNTIIESRYRDVKLFDDVPIPYKTDVKLTKDNQKLSLEYRKIEVNKEIQRLSIKIPKDANIIQW